MLVDTKSSDGLRAVRVVRQQSAAAIVEWSDDSGHMVRSIVSSVDVINVTDGGRYVRDEILQAALLYGFDLSSIELPAFGNHELAELLHKADLWTADDILRRRGELLAALDEIKLAHLRAIIDFVSGGK